MTTSNKNSQLIDPARLEWSAVDDNEPIHFAEALRTQICLPFARLVSEWLGRATTPKSIITQALALRIELGADEDRGITLSQTAAKFGIDQPRLTRALQELRGLAGMDHLHRENPEEPPSEEAEPEEIEFCE